MSRQIYVQAQADHIASLAKATPLAAIEELVWNALDADAREVRIDVITNALGAVTAVRVSDDGTGIDVLKADSTFGSLGGSWKRLGSETPNSRRRLHGRHGRGRFKAFALGSSAEWRTTVRIGGDLLSYVISGELANPGVFGLEAAAQPGPGTGTEVYVTGACANCDSLLDAASTVQALAAKFALYLKSYPDVRIYFNGLPVTPVIVQRKTSGYTIHIGNGAEARLEVIEWKCKFPGAGRLVFAGTDGFQLHEQPAGVRSGGVPFTAYLVSSRFPELAAENALVMDELNPEVRMYIDEAKKTLKAHFLAEADDSIKAFKKEWKAKIESFSDKEIDTLLALLKKASAERKKI
ncbi:MAG: ATP-binding protein [Kiritimatiellae bacterium]|nr:ATP-binding protein [Kiritimatiellia bacterium]